jgi:cytochrome c oxidase subunit 2
MRGKVLLALATLLSLAGTAAARFGMPEALTDRGRTVEDIYAKVTAAGIVVFVLVFALLVFVLVRYREGSGKGRATHERHRGSLAAELTWTLVPLAVVLWIGAIAYAGLVHLDRGEEQETAEMTLHVTGVQWAWQVDYGSGVMVNVVTQPDAKGNLSYSDTIHVPADVPIELNLTGGDVIHAFNILDANRAFFFMEDANPLGPHKYHTQVLTFPAGRYEIQCKEMCLNPGHGYMRAQLVAEPRPAYDAWFQERSLAAGHDLVARVAVTADASSLQTADSTTLVKGTRALVTLSNTGPEGITVTLPDGTQRQVGAGASDLFAFDAPDPGNYTLSASNGASLTFTAIDAKVIDVDLRSYKIQPQQVQLDKGTNYLFRVKVEDSVHNYFIGHWDGSGAKAIVAQSPTISGGSTGAFVFTPTESGSYDTWCDVPGHYGLGMHAHATVG